MNLPPPWTVVGALMMDVTNRVGGSGAAPAGHVLFLAIGFGVSPALEDVEACDRRAGPREVEWASLLRRPMDEVRDRPVARKDIVDGLMLAVDRLDEIMQRFDQRSTDAPATLVGMHPLPADRPFVIASLLVGFIAVGCGARPTAPSAISIKVGDCVVLVPSKHFQVVACTQPHTGRATVFAAPGAGCIPNPDGSADIVLLNGGGPGPLLCLGSG